MCKFKTPLFQAELRNIHSNNILFVHMGHLVVYLTSATQNFQSVYLCQATSICSSNCPRHTFVSCFGSPRVHVPQRLSCSFHLPFVSQDYGLSSFPRVKQSLSILLPDLIMSVVREAVASPESHGRQLHSEVGHMVRWVTRADSNRPRDAQRDLAAGNALRFLSTRTWRCFKSQQQEKTVGVVA